MNVHIPCIQILEALLMNTASTFLDFDSSRGEAMQGPSRCASHFIVSISTKLVVHLVNCTVSEGVVTPASGPSPAGSRPATPAVPAPSSSSASAHSAPGPGLHGGSGGPQDGAALGGSSINAASAGNRARRRKMVLDCKAMRVQVSVAARHLLNMTLLLKRGFPVGL
jgi:hypothetical protein